MSCSAAERLNVITLHDVMYQMLFQNPKRGVVQVNFFLWHNK